METNRYDFVLEGKIITIYQANSWKEARKLSNKILKDMKNMEKKERKELQYGEPEER